MLRPELTRELSESEFRAWYWLKSELAIFCRREDLSATGSKQALADRIAAHLSSRPLPATPPGRKTAGSMPTRFTMETVIEDGWRCTRDLREFRLRNPSSTHAEAFAAWWARRGKPGNIVCT